MLRAVFALAAFLLSVSRRVCKTIMMIPAGLEHVLHIPEGYNARGSSRTGTCLSARDHGINLITPRVVAATAGGPEHPRTRGVFLSSMAELRTLAVTRRVRSRHTNEG